MESKEENQISEQDSQSIKDKNNNNQQENKIEENSINTDLEKCYIKEVRLAVIGNVDSGKSTLVGCLTKGIKDDGRGYARKFVFNYEHENQTGRTSSIAEEIIGFKNGELLTCGRLNDKKNTTWKEVTSQADHILTLIDLCGHEKYLKTTMYGLTAYLPDYAIILIGTNMGVQRMTKEHLGIVVSLNIPFFIVFTKIDIAPTDVRENTINTFSTLVKNGLQKTVYHVKNAEDAVAASNIVVGGAIVPFFQISTVTGEGMDNLKKFLSGLQPRFYLNSEHSIIKLPTDPVELILDSVIMTKVGIIYAGLLISGTISVGQKLMLGPFKDGTFHSVQIRNIHFLRSDVGELLCGNSCSVKLKSLEKNFELTMDNFRKGMVLLPPDNIAQPSIEFEIEALIVHHASTIKCGYQSVVHCNVVRQTATIVGMSKDVMRAGDSGIIRFKFIKSPEYLHLGQIVLFREGRTRGKGKIIKLTPYDPKVSEDKKKIKDNKKGNKTTDNIEINTNKTTSNKGESQKSNSKNEGVNTQGTRQKKNK